MLYLHRTILYRRGTTPAPRGRVHFNKRDSGTLLAADMMVHWLVRGQAALAALSEAQRAALSYSMPAKPIYPAALQQYTTRCYGMSIKGALDLIKAGRAGSIQKETLEQIEAARPGVRAGRAAGRGSRPYAWQGPVAGAWGLMGHMGRLPRWALWLLVG